MYSTWTWTPQDQASCHKANCWEPTYPMAGSKAWTKKETFIPKEVQFGKKIRKESTLALSGVANTTSTRTPQGQASCHKANCWEQTYQMARSKAWTKKETFTPKEVQLQFGKKIRKGSSSFRCGKFSKVHVFNQDQNTQRPSFLSQGKLLRANVSNGGIKNVNKERNLHPKRSATAIRQKDKKRKQQESDPDKQRKLVCGLFSRKAYKYPLPAPHHLEDMEGGQYWGQRRLFANQSTRGCKND